MLILTEKRNTNVIIIAGNKIEKCKILGEAPFLMAGHERGTNILSIIPAGLTRGLTRGLDPLLTE